MRRSLPSPVPTRTTRVHGSGPSARRLASSPFITTKPLRGTMRVKWPKVRCTSVEVAEDVRVVELEVVEHRDVRRVVDELAALVEERAVVLVALDHERVGRRAEVAAGRRILRHAADEKARVAAVLAQEKRGERGRGRLAVRAGHDDVAPVPEHEVVQQGRQRGERQRAGVEQPLDLGVAAGHGVADDHQVGREFFQPGGIVALVDGDAGLGEHRAHRRIDAAVGAEHLVAGGAREQRGIAHRRSADAHEINAHFSLNKP